MPSSRARNALRRPAAAAIVLRRALLAPCACMLGFVACAGDGALARLDIEPASATLAYPHTTIVDLTWTPLAALPETDRPPTVFVHLLDRREDIALTFDHPFPEAWQPGRPVSYALEVFQSGLDPPLATGTYALSMGLVHPSGRRSRLSVDGPEIAESEYAVARFEVPDGVGATPRFSFSGSWEEPLSTESRQTLFNRRLGHSAGRMVVWGVDRPGEARVSVSIFEAPQAAGAEPSIEVRSGCGAVRGRLVGAGTHELSLTVDPTTVGDTCTVTFDPDRSFRASGHRRSALLRRVSWVPTS